MAVDSDSLLPPREIAVLCSHGRTITDPATTELICSDCGAVLAPPEIMVGGGVDYGDGNGRPLRHHEPALPHRMGTIVPKSSKTWNLGRYQRRSHHEAMGGRKDRWFRELNRLAKRLETPKVVLQAAERGLTAMLEKNNTAGYSTETIAAALIWLFRRELGCPEPMTQFRNRAGLPRRSFNHAVALCKRTLHVGLVPVGPRVYLERIRPDTDPKVVRLAERVLHAWNDDPDPQPVVTPAVLAASSVYLAGKCIAYPARTALSQRTISEKFSCTEVSCRTGMKTLGGSMVVGQLLRSEGFDITRILQSPGARTAFK